MRSIVLKASDGRCWIEVRDWVEESSLRSAISDPVEITCKIRTV